MAKQTQYRHVGDTKTALSVTLQRDGSAINYSGNTIKFKMVRDSDRKVKVALTTSGVTEEAPSSGTAKFTFSANQVNEPGVYNAYFVEDDGSGNGDTFPAQKGDLQVVIEED